MAQPLQDPRRTFPFPPSYLLGDATAEHNKGQGHSSQLYLTSLAAWPLRPPTRQRSLQHLLCRICLVHLTPPVRSWGTCRFSSSQGFVTTSITTHHYRGHYYHKRWFFACACVWPSLRSGSRSGAVCDRGGGSRASPVANSVPFFEHAPLSHMCALPSLGGIWNTPIKLVFNT